MTCHRNCGNVDEVKDFDGQSVLVQRNDLGSNRTSSSAESLGIVEAAYPPRTAAAASASGCRPITRKADSDFFFKD